MVTIVVFFVAASFVLAVVAYMTCYPVAPRAALSSASRSSGVIPRSLDSREASVVRRVLR